jgi:arylsulfatase A-like enzyme
MTRYCRLASTCFPITGTAERLIEPGCDFHWQLDPTTLDRIASMGLRYTQFHTTSLCSPTRAALITGRNHHSVGFGVISEAATGYPGYDSVIGLNNATIGQILKATGYATSWFGKNHNTPSYVTSQAGPFDQWPVGMNFEYFYGFNSGETNQWQLDLYRNTARIYPFDEIFSRVRERSLSYWADPRQTQPGEINTHDGGRGFYFEDPNGHFLEVITRPYGSGDQAVYS